MIIGIGTDIVDISRIEKLAANLQTFAGKVLSKEELRIFSEIKLQNKKISYLAKRFAAKEAFVKALGTGFRDGLFLPNISILNDKLGKPEVKLDEKNQDRFAKGAKIDISLSDEKKYVIAFVIISKE
jgi:holo-[acyl-carrier protein] synthase